METLTQILSGSGYCDYGCLHQNRCAEVLLLFSKSPSPELIIIVLILASLPAQILVIFLQLFPPLPTAQVFADPPQIPILQILIKDIVCSTRPLQQHD
uniref:Ovule protein n=1 Tax=Syphacia muris TaxID=451379 RepID=A0A0N5APJ9_9BILA